MGITVIQRSNAKTRKLNPRLALVLAGGAVGWSQVSLGPADQVEIPGWTWIFLIGAFVELFALKADLPQEARVFLTVGICGGFTTFSTFSLDAYVLMERGEWLPAAAYTPLRWKQGVAVPAGG